jgi:hypothetical protein
MPETLDSEEGKMGSGAAEYSKLVTDKAEAEYIAHDAKVQASQEQHAETTTLDYIAAVPEAEFKHMKETALSAAEQKATEILDAEPGSYGDVASWSDMPDGSKGILIADMLTDGKQNIMDLYAPALYQQLDAQDARAAAGTIIDYSPETARRYQVDRMETKTTNTSKGTIYELRGINEQAHTDNVMAMWMNPQEVDQSRGEAS